MKRVLAATIGCIILALYLGWRGSSLSQQGEINEIQQTIGTELGLAKELVLSKLTQFESDAFNIVSAEYLQHTSHTPGVTTDLTESPFSAVGVMELKEKGFEPTWFAVNPKTRDAVSQDLLKNMAPEWQGEIRQMERHLFIRAEDLKQEPMMVFLSRIELPNTQTSAVAVAVLPARALKLNPQTLRESFLWDQKGYIWGYQNPAYVGAALKNDPLVKASLGDEKTANNFLQFQMNGHKNMGAFAPIPDSNLFVGLSREITPVMAILSSWWISLAMALIGASFLSFAAFGWLEQNDNVIEMPMIVTTNDRVHAPMKAPAPVTTEDLNAVINEDTVDPADLDPTPLKEPMRVVTADHLPEVTAPVETVTPPPIPSPTEEPTPSASLENVLRRALAPFRARLMADNVELRENIPAGIFVKAKPAQLQTAFEEIIKNALDAMADSETKRLTIETGIETGYARVTIRDTGLGISAEDQPKIFDPFFTRKPESSRGLGLTVVKRLLELVEGESRVESEEGKGTSISLLIPASGVQIMRDLAPSAPQAPPKIEIGLSVLIGDDESEPMQEYIPKVDIRKPKVRMFD